MAGPILNRTVYVTNYIFESLSALAEIRGVTPDMLATEMLGTLLEKHHRLDWLRDRTKADRKKRADEYVELLKQPCQS